MIPIFLRLKISLKVKYSLPDRYSWTKTSGPKHVIWFTDGSKTKDGVGAGLCGPGKKDEQCIRLQDYNTVFQAELFAIKRCAELLMVKELSNKTIRICSDSQAALKALDGPLIESRLVIDTRDVLNHVARDNKVTLTWIPGHSGWHGNERADKLAKKATTRELFNHYIRLPHKEIVKRLSVLVEK